MTTKMIIRIEIITDEQQLFIRTLKYSFFLTAYFFGRNSFLTYVYLAKAIIKMFCATQFGSLY
jgi:hypothetical protein